MRIVEFKPSKYKHYSLIEGFPSKDLIATITTKYLIDKLKMKQIGYVESKEFFPVVRIENGLALNPIRIYESKKYKLIAFLPDQLIANNLIFDYCNLVIRWAEQKKIKQIFTIGSIQSTNANVFGITNNEKNKDFLRKYNISFATQGLVSGINAQFLMLDTKLPIYLFLGSFGKTTSYEASAKILDKFNQIFDTNINTKPLLEQSKKMMEEIKKQMQNIKDKHNETKQIMYS